MEVEANSTYWAFWKRSKTTLVCKHPKMLFSRGFFYFYHETLANHLSLCQALVFYWQVFLYSCLKRTGFTIVSGHYCLVNTTQPKEFQCPPGTFNPKTAQVNRSSCHNCTPGMYCEGTGNEYPTGNCSAGWYCSGGAYEFQPSGGTWSASLSFGFKNN